MSRLQSLRKGVSRLADRLSERLAQAGKEPDDTPPATSVRSPAPAATAGGGSPPPSSAGPAASPVQPPSGPPPAVMVPWGVRVAAEVGWRLLVLAGVLYVLMKVISAFSLLVLAFSVGLLLTALLQPTVARLRRLGVGRGAATAITFVTGVAALGLVGWFVVWQVMENIDDLTRQVQDGIEELRNWLLDGPFHVTEEQINNVADSLNDWIGGNTQAITDAGLQGVTVVVEFLTGAALALFVAIFLLYDGRRVWNWTLNFVPRPARDGIAGAGPRAWTTLTSYVRGTVIVAFIDGFFIGVGIYFLDVPMAVPLAVIVFLSAFVPIVGAFTSGTLAVLVAFVTNGMVTALLVLAVVLAVQQLEGHVLQPFILGRLVRVHPLGVVLAVTGGSLLAGIPGAVVAVPVVAVLNSVVGYLREYAAQNAMHGEATPHGATAEFAVPEVAAGGAAAGESGPGAGAPER
ncbi:AI-2E family transporter [Streptomyces sp. TRM 70361]|uniref:AI-2E family transporter n=1 Tax=Streptomyces sp. TRM 70361 TaxID=3116553 RepID=UPI002E7B75ED|nr:AI-2E family transporter [Streptomyces sp. TRM 70361]MEE1939270.1 AI-2E family transporter [Streptomyces sp. TRM 70361]